MESIYTWLSQAQIYSFLYSNLCIELFHQRQAFSEGCYIHEKQSGTVSTHTAWCLFFANADGTTAAGRFLYPNLYIESLRQRQAYSESCYIHEKQSGTVFTHTAWRLSFPNADGTTATWRFFYPNLCIESLRQCGHMGDNPHHAIMTGKLLQQLYRILQRHFI